MHSLCDCFQLDVWIFYSPKFDQQNLFARLCSASNRVNEVDKWVSVRLRENKTKIKNEKEHWRLEEKPDSVWQIWTRMAVNRIFGALRSQWMKNVPLVCVLSNDNASINCSVVKCHSWVKVQSNIDMLEMLRLIRLLSERGSSLPLDFKFHFVTAPATAVFKQARCMIKSNK